jgi:hypothetical protein
MALAVLFRHQQLRLGRHARDGRRLAATVYSGLQCSHDGRGRARFGVANRHGGPGAALVRAANRGGTRQRPLAQPPKGTRAWCPLQPAPDLSGLR